MLDNFEIEIAKSLDAKPELLPFIPELVADIWALGSSPDLAVEILKPVDLSPQTTRVLDFGCGKGAVSIHKISYHGLTIASFLVLCDI